jgi:hypothetical protein
LLWHDVLKKQRKEENVGITYKSDVRNDDDDGDDSDCERPSKKNKRSRCEEHIPEDVAGEGRDGESQQDSTAPTEHNLDQEVYGKYSKISLPRACKACF